MIKNVKEQLNFSNDCHLCRRRQQLFDNPTRTSFKPNQEGGNYIFVTYSSVFYDV